MNAAQLQQSITAALNEALNSETRTGEAIAILETAKLDVYGALKQAAKAKNIPIILPASSIMNMNGGGR